ncbi:DUF4244 domain-containing protein [Sphaerisporangium sp. TRM90804]|uniref:DUF4244 domain-containing protein n=1 Tax=Sphaerisporangium sp. TRM90804 TaxID=3031113 RepID=UPI00326334F0
MGRRLAMATGRLGLISRGFGLISCRFAATGRKLVTTARVRSEAGMSTAEYAVGTIAACAFAGLLFKIVTSPEIRKMLSDLIARALKLAG